ncbi:hypothetical protein VKT23_016086 [Stygiomarasmius scandens]|uniref:Cytochrome P450 n=1 Tax=Marasmiellus scandens TaxID=2682957 RepID=A0ABR1IZ34_9AGAR
MAGSLIMSATYGIEVAPRGDPYVMSADRALDGFTRAAIHGTFWVDYFPFLRYVPSWFPGASFQRKAKAWKRFIQLCWFTRTQPVNPLALAHYTTEDDYYKGYFIPKNSVVIGNAWAILHDKILYPDPDTFNPSRWLTSDGKINTDMKAPLSTFGFGRRACPGMHMALSSMWMTITSTLLTFNISERVTEDGEIIKLAQEYESSLQK